MAIEIKWIQHASFRIASDACVLYIDPWKLPDAPHDADVVFVSHSHYDHCSPADIAKVSKDDTAVIAPAETIAKLHAAQREKAAEPDELITVKDITVETVAAYNVNKTFHPKGNNWCGGVFTMGGKRVYYAGDTDLIPEMSGLAEIDVALLPVGGTYTLDAAEAVDACRAIGCGAAIPYHWGDIVGSADDAQAFADAAPCTVHLLQPGEAIRL